MAWTLTIRPFSALWLVAILLLAASVACSEPAAPTGAGLIQTPTGPFQVQEIANTKEHHKARADVLFNRGPVLVEDVVAQFHESKTTEAFIGARRHTGTYTTLRFHANVDTIAALDIGQTVRIRCNRLEEGRGGWSPFSSRELVCRGQVLG